MIVGKLTHPYTIPLQLKALYSPLPSDNSLIKDYYHQALLTDIA